MTQSCDFEYIYNRVQFLFFRLSQIKFVLSLFFLDKELKNIILSLDMWKIFFFNTNTQCCLRRNDDFITN